MMMSKPAPERQEEPEQAPAAASKAPTDAVADLERRLAALSSEEEATTNEEDTKPAAAPSAPAPPTQEQAPSKTGKNALLARIMAAQERAKQAQAPVTTAPASAVSAPAPAVASAPPPDLLGMSAPPAEEEAPPPFSEELLPPTETEAPPAFDAVEQSLFGDSHVPSQQQPVLTWDPHAPTATISEPTIAAPPPAPSAPSHDLLESTTAPPTQAWEPMAPPEEEPAAAQEEDLDNVLGLQGMSEEEKKELLAEQAKIMAQIESSKSSSAAAAQLSAADAFEQRSLSAAVGATSTATASPGRKINLGSGQEVALHGQERTREAIEDGTAVLVECLSCHNWMQVTQTATLMFCPVCQVVSPVEHQGAHTEAEAAQLQSDRELAEQLQREEYKQADNSEERRASQQQRSRQQRQHQEEQSQSWMEWLGLSSSSSSSSKTPTRPSSQPPAFAIPAERPLRRGEIGTSRPPGAAPGGLAQARTGSEEIVFSGSYDEQDRLLASDNVPRARVAEQKPLFSCVADSITSAASSLSTALNTQNLSEDDEGNVHGVDASSLLAVPNVSRETRYEQLDDNDNK